MDFHFTVILHFRYCVLQNLDNHETSFKLLYRLKLVKAVATAPEKTPTEKVKFIEPRDHHQSIPRQKLPLEKKTKKTKKTKKNKKLPPLIYTVQVQYDDHDDHDHDHPTL